MVMEKIKMVTYKQTIAYIKEHDNVTVKPCWIAHMKEKCGLPVRHAPNRKDPYKRCNPCPLGKEKYILNAFRDLGLIHDDNV